MSENHIVDSFDTLYAPTQIMKFPFDANYFIVDCWHGRVIYNSDLNAPIVDWKNMTMNTKGGHTIASDGKLYLVDCTEADRVDVFCKTESGAYRKTQEVDFRPSMPIGFEYYDKNYKMLRPHYVFYDSAVERFLVALSYAGCMASLKTHNGIVKMERIWNIPELNGKYFRSFQKIGDHYFLVAGSEIFCLSYDGDNILLKFSQKLPTECCNVAYITKIFGYWYITCACNGVGSLLRFKTLGDFSEGRYENLNDIFGFVGNPYYISHSENKFFITVIEEKEREYLGTNAICSFNISLSDLLRYENICNVEYIKKYPGGGCISVKRRKSIGVHLPWD